MHTHLDDGDWQQARKRYKESTALPAVFLVPSISRLREEINESSKVPASAGPSFKQLIKQASIPSEILSTDHLAILDQVEDASDLIEKVKSRQWNVEEVIESHLRMAAIAQQALGCYSTIFFDDARAKAKELDKQIQAGKDCGRLCGLPISIKAFNGLPGTGSDRGFIFDVLDPSTTERLLKEEERTGAKSIPKSALRMLRLQGPHLQTNEAVHIRALLNEGAIVIAKTVMPQSVMQLDTCSNLHGQTLNPWNMHLSPGGSSGGDSASVSSGATMLGIGSDIGGSVRQPAAVTGLYGIRCTVGRIGIDGYRTTMPGNLGILSTVGPLCRSLRDLKLATEILVQNTADSNPYTTPPLPWRSILPPRSFNRKLRVGVLKHDGVVLPITPIRRALQQSIERLSKVDSIEVVHCEPDDYYRKGWDLARQLYFMDGGHLIRALAKITNEPLLPLTEYILSSPVKDHSASESWELQSEREAFKLGYWRDVWIKNDLDVLLCPAAHLCAPRLGQIKYWNYTSFFNLVDLPGAVFPVQSTTANARVDIEYEETERPALPDSMSSYDEEARQEYLDHRETFDGAPIGLQLIGRRFQEEELLSALEIIDGAVNGL